jgi:hypothetical protein
LDQGRKTGATKMTSLYAFDRMHDRITAAKEAGFLLKSGLDWGVRVILDVEKFPGAAEDVIIYSAKSVEDALLFIDGVQWAMQWEMLKPVKCKQE